MTRADLRKQIYLTCLSNTHYRGEDMAKAMRADISFQMFGKAEEELTDKELTDLLHFLRFGVKLCTKKQENTVRGYAFEFAIYYHDYSKFKVINKVGEVMNPNDVKLMIQELYKNGTHRDIPSKYKKALVKETANPICNRLLWESDLRQEAKKPDVFYYEKMTASEADYLIRRFMKLLSEVKIQHSLGVEKQISNN